MKERSEPKAGAVDKVQPIEGRSKSGRFWKAKATERNSVQLRQGIMSHLSNTYAQRMKEKERKEAIKALEKQMREEKAEEKRLAREKTEEKKKRKMENEFRSAKYDVINPQRLKTMNKKQLRTIKKTRMNNNGAIELVGAYQK
jgi:hypothetical protein